MFINKKTGCAVSLSKYHLNRKEKDNIYFFILKKSGKRKKICCFSQTTSPSSLSLCYSSPFLSPENRENPFFKISNSIPRCSTETTFFFFLFLFFPSLQLRRLDWMGTLLTSCSFSYVNFRLHSLPLDNERIQMFKLKGLRKKKGYCYFTSRGVSYKRASFGIFRRFRCFCSVNDNDPEKNEDNISKDSSVSTASPDEAEEKSSNSNEFTSDKTPTSVSSPVHCFIFYISCPFRFHFLLGITKRLCHFQCFLYC